MRHIAAIFKKQARDTRKNPVLLLQLILYPVMILILNNTVTFEDMPPNYFTEMFSAMFVGMAPLITCANVVSEEKEKGTLRALLMSGVHPFAYLGGIGLFLFSVCLLGSAVIAAQAGYTLMRSLLFVLYLSLGCLISEILGATIGIARASQTSATGTAVPVMSVMTFLPLLATFNETIAKVAGFTYTERIKNLISGLSYDTMEAADLLVVFGSLAVALLLFTFIYKRNGLE